MAKKRRYSERKRRPGEIPIPRPELKAAIVWIKGEERHRCRRQNVVEPDCPVSQLDAEGHNVEAYEERCGEVEQAREPANCVKSCARWGVCSVYPGRVQPEPNLRETPF